MQLINPNLEKAEKISALTNEFKAAHPYPHVVIDNFLVEDVANKLYDNFPDNTKLDKHWKGMNEQKSEGSNFYNFDDVFSALKKFIMSPEMSIWIEKVTGVKNGMVTDDKMGCGVHQGKDGSFLDIHVDFSMHHHLKLLDPRSS